jgi:putative membrane protein insertion efficiency factor
MRLLLKIYKTTLSPILKFMFGGGCRYNPTCSEYTVDVIEKYGIIKGIPLAIKRVLKCNSWSQ